MATVDGLVSDSNYTTYSSPSSALLENAQLPFYLSEIFSDLYEEDGLAVLGRGLGLLQLMACFCRFYAQSPEDQEAHDMSCTDQNPTSLVKSTNKPILVFVLGLREHERHPLIEILESWGTYPHLLPIIITNEIGQSHERIQLYSRGGIFIITSRILIVDLLSGVLDASSIDGFLVAHAESISEQSTESFILRLFRTQRKWSCVMADGNTSNTSTTSHAVEVLPSAITQDHFRCDRNKRRINDSVLGSEIDSACATKNPSMDANRLGFIKAFTDAPDALLAGFAKVDKVLKALFVRRLYLYPRNHETIAEELENIYPPKVEGVSIPLTSCMKEMQNAIAACVQVGDNIDDIENRFIMDDQVLH